MSNDKFRYNLLKTQSNLKHQNVFLDSYPSQIHFLMIDKCNANCIMCGGDYFKSKSGRVITLDKFKKMAVNLKFELVGGIVLAGAGDPLLNRDLVLIIQFVRANYPHINISVTTNGLALTEDVSGKMINSDTNLVNISINSATRGTYKRIMQLDGFEAVCRNARNFVEMRNRSKKPVALQFSAAINRLNIEELPRLVELGREIGANGINLFYTRYYPEQIRHANVDDPADRLEDSTSLFYHQELSDSMVLEAKDLAQKFGIGLTHEPLFRDHAGAPPCTWAMTQLMVGFDGEVYPCGGSEVHFREKVEGGVYDFGNALHDHIDTFWNNELYRALRHSSRQVGECLVSECGCCANVVSPNDIKSHIMHWDQHDSINGRKEPCGLPRDDRKMATSSSPLVSVIVPTYNRPDQLVGALRSILGQSYKEVEIIVVNDCGADVESILSFLNKKNQITYIRHGKNRGLAAARNTGIKIARGKYIAYLDDDDIYYPNHIETLVRFLETSDHKVAYTDAHRAHQFQQNGVYVVTKRDVPYSFDFDYDRILQTNFLPVLCLMHERECLEVVDFFDEDLKRLEDWDLWIRLSRTLKFAHIKKVTCEFSWRIDGSTMTSAQDQEFDHARKYISQKYGRMHSANSSQLKIEGPSVKKMVSIIILTYNQLEFTKECVNSIQKHTKEPYEIIFVDNSSTDGTRKWLGKIVNDNPNYKLIENPKNLGFAKGCNQGMKASSGEYIVLLNNDVIVTGNWLSGLLEGLAEHPEVGIVGPMTNNISGPQKIPDVGYDSLDGIEKYAHSFREKNRNRRIRWRRIVGFCMLFRHELVNEIGGLDESFGSGNFEDDDYCLRVELAGYKNFIVGDVFIHHFGSVTFVGNKIDYGTSITGNRKIFDQKWGGIDINSPLGGQVLVLNAFEKADELSQKGLVEKAIEILSGIIAHVPEEKRAYYILTEIFLNTKQYDKALDVLDKMLEHLKDLRHKELLAYSMMGLDRVKDAELCADAILNSDPLSAPALIVKGIVASKQGDTESAELYLNKAISVNPSSGYSYTNMGLLRQEQGKKQEALPLLEKGAILSPLFLDAVSDYLEAALEAGAFEKVEHFLKEAVSLHPNNKRLKYAYIDILLKQKKNGKAQQQKEEAKAWFGPEIDIGSWTMQPGEENLNCEREKVQLASFDINITVSLIIRVISEFDVLQKCIKSFEKYTEVPFELILIVDSLSKKNKERLNKISANIVNLKLIKIKKGTSSGHCYNEGLKESKGEFFVFCHSDIIFSCGWYDSFSKSISNAANVGIVGPLLNDVEGLQRYKNASGVSIDQFDEIAQKIQEHYRHRRISINKLSSYCFMCRRALFKNVGCFDEKFVMEDFLMEDFCRRISIAGRENFIVADVLLYHFDNHKKKLKGEKKTQAFKADKMAYVEKWGAVKLDTPLGSRLLLLKSLDKAKTLEQQEDVEKAASQLLKTIAHAPKDKAAYLALAELFFQAKQYDEALGVLGKFPDVKDPKYTELIGYCMEGKGNIEEAEKYAEKALSINSKSPQALNLKGVCLYKNGKKGESEEYIKKAIESDPGYGEPYTNIGLIKWEVSPDEQALNYLEKGFALSPNIIDNATNYHSAITALGLFDRAESFFRDAVDLYPHNKRLVFLYIDILIKLNNYESAMHEIEKAIVHFGVDDDLLAAALNMRDVLGPKEIDSEPQKRKTISLCIITKNEEKHIANCLKSVSSTVDEMIVVDTGSHDRTKEIAKIFGAKVFDSEWKDDFSEARNVSLAKANGDWILVLDADEVVSAKDYELLHELVEKGTSKAFIVLTRNYVKGVAAEGWVANNGQYPEEETGAGWYPSEKVRLFQRDINVRFENPVHELVEPALARNGISFINCNLIVHHYGRLDEKKVSDKGETYYQLGLKKLKEQGESLNALNELAVQAGELGKYEEAIELWKEVLKLVPQDASRAFLNMGFAYMQLEKYEASILASKQALKIAPNLKEAALNYATCSVLIGEIEEVMVFLEGFLSKGDFYPSAMGILAAVYCIDNQLEKGRKLFTKVRSMGFNINPFIEFLIEKLEVLGKNEIADKLRNATLDFL